MRPTDENQAASKRPNLISSQRRGHGEINILAMLEGDGGRPLARRLAKLPMALWYGGAGLMACVLVGTLAWLARDAGPVRHERPALANGRVSPSDAPEIVAPPPLQIPLQTADTAPPVPVLAAPAPAAKVAPPMMAIARPQAPAHVTLPVRATAARTAPHNVTIVHAPPPAVRVRRAAPPRARPAAAPAVDTDVALISAIIEHGGVQAPRADGCVDRTCAPLLPEQP